MSQPWKMQPLDEWSIVGMNHYHVDGEPFLFVSMAKNGRCIIEQGPDDEFLWNRLWQKATDEQAMDIGEIRRLELKKGHEHLTVTTEFQSDKYPWCPAGFVPLKITDPMARDPLWDYARRRRPIDKEFSRDLEIALAFAESNHRD